MRAEAKKPIKSRKTGAKLYASTVSRQLVEHLSSANDNSTEYQRDTIYPENTVFSGFSLFSGTIWN
ncbi:MAG: hypothetical protein U0N50_06820, partial [Christensenellales bacterium]